MRQVISKIATIAVIAPLAGAALLTPASATAATSAKAADEPYSKFDVEVKGTQQIRPGGTLQYAVVGTNRGPHTAEATDYQIVFQLPKGLDSRKAKGFGPKGSECAVEKGFLYCSVGKAVPVGESVDFKFQLKTGPDVKGTLTAILGVLSFNAQTGVDQMSEEELKRIGGISSWGYGKPVKTKVVR
ncbi:hypothetical protein [Nonomuraea sp. NPDC049784]|uniref:hypothetical protein n=1 Tax=Nonomuraea sp. NPDC049784 TaxID=3154361 RepID=UPI003411493C